MNWFFEVLKKYAVFSGRARRKEYWMFVLFNLIIFAALYLLEKSTGIRTSSSLGRGFGPLVDLYLLAVALPALALSVRRLHDTGRSGWWMLLGFVPVIGPFALLALAAVDSQPGANKYGPNPKAAALA